MTILKATLYSLATASLLMITPAAHADVTTSCLKETAPLQDEACIQYLRLWAASGARGETYIGSTRTATFFYKKGVKNFEKGNLEKADQHFKAALRADGSRGLDKATYHYLTNIKHTQGDELQSEKYAKAYFDLN